MTGPTFRDFSLVTQEPAPALDRLLREHISGASWAQVRKLIATGKVFVDGMVVTDPRAALATGQCLELRLRTPRAKSTSLPESCILHADPAIVVVNKPAGIATVPFEDQEPDALSEQVRKLLSRQSKGRCPPLGVVQRLDKLTSGCLVFARSVPAKRSLQQQFRDHSVQRSYRAIVHGRMASQTLRLRLVRDRGDGKRGSTREAHLGRDAVTHVTALEVFEAATLIECRLETGRTHQIRIHCAEAGHPLVGERVYAQSSIKDAAPRQQLHAYELGFLHPLSGKQLKFQVPFPRDMQAQLERLRVSDPASRE